MVTGKIAIRGKAKDKGMRDGVIEFALQTNVQFVFLPHLSIEIPGHPQVSWRRQCPGQKRLSEDTEVVFESIGRYMHILCLYEN